MDEREERVRQALAAKGLTLVRDPRRKEWQAADPLTSQPKHTGRGGGYLVHDGHQVVAGEWYSLTLEEAEAVISHDD